MGLITAIAKMFRRQTVMDTELKTLKDSAASNAQAAGDLLKVATEHTGQIGDIVKTTERFQKNHVGHFKAIGDLEKLVARLDERTAE